MTHTLKDEQLAQLSVRIARPTVASLPLTRSDVAVPLAVPRLLHTWLASLWTRAEQQVQETERREAERARFSLD